ncbi:MAG: hypothetical protein ACTXOO_03915 [Sodalis sp. (in: enterobacteria)]
MTLAYAGGNSRFLKKDAFLSLDDLLAVIRELLNSAVSQLAWLALYLGMDKLVCMTSRKEAQN